MTRPPIGVPGAGLAAGHRGSTGPPTGCGTRWSADQPTQAAAAVATRYDKLAVRYRAPVHIAAINEWL
jgi:hypothetical protein